jgi:GNAT superfamily N-acetyltransferase
VIVVRELDPGEVDFVDRYLPLSRLDQQVAEGSTYLIAWDDRQPVGHAHVAWRGLTAAAEERARARGCGSISLSVSESGNPEARRLYDALGYVDAGVEPVRVSGTIMLRGRPFPVDDTLVYLSKAL